MPSRRAELLLVALLAACAPSPRQGDPAPSRPPAVVLGEAEVEAIAAILRLEDRRELDLQALGKALHDPVPEVRRRAALAVGRIGESGPHGARPDGAGPSAAASLLLQALGDEAAAVRADAAFALGELRDTSAAVLEGLAALVRRAAEPGAGPGNLPPALEAAGALGKLGGSSPVARAALEPLVAAPAARGTKATSGAPRWPEPLVHEALLAVWRLERWPGLAAALAAGLHHPDPEIRWRSAYALMRLGDPAAVDSLIPRLADPDHRVAEFAARALRAPVVDSAGGDLRRRALAALVPAAVAGHPHVRINALRALATFGDPAALLAATPLLAEPARLRDPAGEGEAGDHGPTLNLAIAEAQALGAARHEDAARRLAAVAADAAIRPAVRGAALAALAAAAPAHAAVLAEGFAEGGFLLRLYAARALGAAPWAEAHALLGRLARDADPRVVAAALESVAASADTLHAAVPLFVEALADPDPGVRAAALRGIAKRADPGDLPLLLHAYDVAARDTAMNDAALAAVDALGALADRGVPVARSFFLRFHPADDPLVRTRVARRLGDGWPPAPAGGPGRDAAFYRTVVRDLVAPELAGGTRPRVRVVTAAGSFLIELLGADAPLTVRNFLDLAGEGFFHGTRWHRVVPNFVIQDGDPRGDGAGGPGYAIRDEPTRARYLRGTVGMALAGPDTGGSQFFVTHSPQPHLDGGYTAFGWVVQGMDVVDRVVQDDPIVSIEVMP